MAIVSKGNLVKGAYLLLRISGLTRIATPADTEIGLQVADDYAAELLSTLDIGWQYPANYGESDPSDNSGLSIQMAGAFKKLLTLQLCSFFGKEIPQALIVTASEGMRSLEQQIVSVPDSLPPSTLPFGSGNEWGYRDRKFYPEPPLNNGASYVFKGDVLNYSEDFSTWLVDATLVSVVWESADSGITIANESFTDNVASAELTFVEIGGYNVCITATKTDSTDVFTVNKNFIIEDCEANRRIL